MKTTQNGTAGATYAPHKLPPQAVDIEEGILGTCIVTPDARQFIAWLKPEHFYRTDHQLIFQAMRECESSDILSLTKYLKTTGKLVDSGWAYRLTQLANKAANPYQLDYYGRIIQQMFIRREIIRVSGENIRKSYEDSEDCITLFDNFYNEITHIESIFNPDGMTHKPVMDYETEADEIRKIREGKLQMGLPTGMETLDRHFRFKQANFVIINGMDNVGKSAVIWYLAVVSNLKHGWKWILTTYENDETRTRMTLIEFATGKPVSKLSETEFQKWLKWSYDNFQIILSITASNADTLLRIAEKILRTFKADAFLIDPYNALEIKSTGDKHFNSHEYHYQVTSRFRSFIKKHKCCIYLNTHAVTEATRRIHKDGDYAGYPMPPEKADAEGGGKFSNRADDFITIHRYIQHPTEFNVAHLHIRKIKETQTGGLPTSKDEPVKIRMVKGYMGFFDMDGKSPIIDTGFKKDVDPDKFHSPSNDEDLPF